MTSESTTSVDSQESRIDSGYCVDVDSDQYVSGSSIRCSEVSTPGDGDFLKKCNLCPAISEDSLDSADVNSKVTNTEHRFGEVTTVNSPVRPNTLNGLKSKHSFNQPRVPKQLWIPPSPANITTHSGHRRHSIHNRVADNHDCVDDPGIVVGSQSEGEAIKSEDESPIFTVKSLGSIVIPDAELSSSQSRTSVIQCIKEVAARVAFSSAKMPSYASSRTAIDVAHSKTGTAARESANVLPSYQVDVPDVFDREALYLLLEDDTLKLLDPETELELLSQPVRLIKVWGVNDKDFAYVSKDISTKLFRCHVFRCQVPARQVASALHSICGRVASRRCERPKSMPPQSCNVKLRQPVRVHETPLFGEPSRMFSAQYQGCVSVSQPTGIGTLNKAISGIAHPDEGRHVRVEVCPSTVTVVDAKDGTVVSESRVRYISFLGIASTNAEMFAFIVASEDHHYGCHVLRCWPNAGHLAHSVEVACQLRYKKCVIAHQREVQARRRVERQEHAGSMWPFNVRSSVQSLMGRFGLLRRMKANTSVE